MAEGEYYRSIKVWKVGKESILRTLSSLNYKLYHHSRKMLRHLNRKLYLRKMLHHLNHKLSRFLNSKFLCHATADCHTISSSNISIARYFATN